MGFEGQILNFFIEEESLAPRCERSSCFFLFFNENCKTYLGIEEKDVEQLPLYHIIC